jgi:LmbE family N-acetylglucosaminyl deacetylase
MQTLTNFSPADIGTPESQWHSMLRYSEEWSPRPGPLVVVAPHPDDEVLGAGGLVSSWAMAGQAVTVVSVTDGEAADAGRRDLDRVRRAELRNALRTLSLLHVTVRRLAIPDGKVDAYKNRLRSAVQECAKDHATIVAPFERDGHPDHEAVGQVCLDVAETDGVPIVRYPVWAWHHAKPASVQALRWGLFRLSTAAQRAKTRALQCFESQLRPPRGGPIVPKHVLAHFERAYEAFVL